MKTKQLISISKLITACMLILFLTTCKETLDGVSATQVFIEQADSEVALLYPIKNDPIKIRLVARLTNPVSRNIRVEFGIDESLLAQFNKKQGKFLSLLPSSAYRFAKKSVVIPAGKIISDSIDLRILDISPMVTGGDFALPLTITKVDGDNDAVIMNGVSSLVTIFSRAVDRSKWTATADSEEKTGEGSNNGRAIHALDNNIGSFWHTQWDGAEPPLPHWILVDMKSKRSISGITMLNRIQFDLGVANIKNFKVEVSENGNDWKHMGNFVCTGGKDLKEFYFSEKVMAQYFKITITSTYGDKNFCFLSELSIK